MEAGAQPPNDAAVAANALVAAAHLIAPVSVKLPPFWADNAEVWFLQAEAQFLIARITVQHTMFGHVLAVLPKEVVTTVLDIARVAANLAAPYDDLKLRLLGSYTQPKWNRMYHLIHHAGLGDMRPSHLMAKMLSLLSPGTDPDEGVLGLYLDRLPVDMRATLSLTDYVDPRQLAADADLIWDARSSVPVAAAPLAAIQRPPSRSPSRPQQPQQRDRRRRGAAPAAARAAPSTSPSDGLCYYHASYAENAHRCRPPCSWQGNGQAAPRRN